MAVAHKSPVKSASKVHFSANTPDYSREIAMMRDKTKEITATRAKAREWLLSAGFVIKEGVVRVDTGK